MEHKTKPGWKPWEPPPETRDRWERWGLRGKTVWDWLNLLVVPVMLALVAGLFTTVQIIYQSAAESQRAQQLADQTSQFQRFIEEFRVQEASLQAYLDLMATLLLEKDLRNSEEDSEVRAIARTQTLTMLRKQDAEGKGTVVSFLHDAGLIQRSDTEGRDEPIVDLGTADLSDADLSLYNLSSADLSEANLEDANLKTTTLTNANLTNADLSDADLSDADLSDADLRFADLSRADLSSNADLSDADLSGADLSSANLSGASLRGATLSYAGLTAADLSRADLTDAQGVTKRGLEERYVKLENTIMPDGTRHD